MKAFSGDRFLNWSTIEKALSIDFTGNLDPPTVHFDFRSATWLSPLGLCTLFSWISELLKKGIRIELAPPESSDSFAARFIESAGFNAILQRLGVAIDSRPPAEPLVLTAAFEHLSSREACDVYLRDMEETQGLQLLLHSEHLPEFITSGEFQRIALRELADNSFTHGDTSACHYSVLEVGLPRGRTREKHPLFATLGGSSYLEIAVADTSSRNLCDTLLPLLPKDYKVPSPERGTRLLSSKLVRCLFYAFEYESTSKPDRRQQAIEALLADTAGDIDARSIATGLFEIASLAQFYRGQIVVRVGSIAATLDFSENARLRAFATNRVDGRLRLAKVPGTIIALRIPLEKAGQLHLAIPPGQEVPYRTEALTPSVSIMRSHAETRAESEAQSLLRVERKVPHSLQRSAAQSKPGHSHRSPLAVLLLDDTVVSAKALAVLLLRLAMIPRKGWS